MYTFDEIEYLVERLKITKKKESLVETLNNFHVKLELCKEISLNKVEYAKHGGRNTFESDDQISKGLSVDIEVEKLKKISTKWSNMTQKWHRDRFRLREQNPIINYYTNFFLFKNFGKTDQKNKKNQF